eukprot:898925-Amphidinium_carterae.2
MRTCGATNDILHAKTVMDGRTLRFITPFITLFQNEGQTQTAEGTPLTHSALQSKSTHGNGV